MESTLTIKLKQHSPLIHYQGGQSGAFLSDAALKAAIDDRMENKVVDNRKETPYSLYSEIEGKIEKKSYGDFLARNTLYFGDQGKSEPSFVVYTPDAISLQIGDYRSIPLKNEKAFDKDLFVNCLKYTLAMNNFGKRGSKGFGCFWIDDGTSLEDYLLQNVKGNVYKHSVKHNANNAWELYKECFRLIDVFYKRLKSGNNSNSILKSYVEDKLKTKWDKEHISSYLKDRKVINEIEMFRFLLGFAKVHEFSELKVRGVTKREGFSIQYSIEDDKGNALPGINRIPSPLTFKVVVTDNNNADVLVFVNPWVQTDDFKKLADIYIKAIVGLKGCSELKFRLASFDLNTFLGYAVEKMDTQKWVTVNKASEEEVAQ